VWLVHSSNLPFEINEIGSGFLPPPIF